MSQFRRASCVLGVLLGTGLLVAAEPSGTWTGFRGPGDSRTSAKNLPLTWKADAPESGYWTIPLPGYGQSSPVIWGDTIFVTTISGKKKEELHVLAVSLADGKTLWQKDFTGTQGVEDSEYVSRGAPTPVADAERLYVVFESGDVVALTHAGEKLWERSIVKDYGELKGNHGYSSSPLLVGGHLILQVTHAGPSYILALNPATGENVWKVDHPAQTGWSSPSVFQQGDATGILVSSVGSVRAFDVRDGKEMWAVTGIAGNSTTTPTVAGDLIVVGGSSDRTPPAGADGKPATNGSLAIRIGGSGDVSQSHVAWKNTKISSGFASPVVVDGLAYFIGRVGAVLCVDVQSGEIKWQHRLPVTAWASPVEADGKIFVFGKDGTVTVLKAGPELEELGQSTIDTPDVVYGVAAVDGAWIIRTGRGLFKVAAPAAAQ